MDLIQSGAIFYFKPSNGLKDDSMSKPTSRFEELFLASPRAKELASSANMSSYLSSSTLLDQNNTTMFTPNKASTTSNSLEYSGLPLDTQIDSPDTRFAGLKTKVNEVINSLATPRGKVNSRDSSTGTNMSRVENLVASDECGDDDNNMIPMCDGYQGDNDIDGYHNNNTSENLDDTETNRAGLPKPFIADKEEDENHIVKANSPQPENGVKESGHPTEMAQHDKEPVPSSVSVGDVATAVDKKAQHLWEWCVKAIVYKNGSGIIVEGQRLEDEKGSKWHSTMIVKRLDDCILETKKKSCYVLEGPIDEQLTLEQGFSAAFVKAFKKGFPSNWKELVEEHFASITSSPSKATKHKKTSNVVNTKKSQRRKKSQDKSKTPTVEVELKRTSSGRLVKPPLAWWRGQRIMTDSHHNLTAIEPGGEEHTSLSTGLYDFDLKVPKEKQSLLKSKMMTPKVAKFDLSPDDKTSKSTDRESKNNNTKKKEHKSTSEGFSKKVKNRRDLRIYSEDTHTDTSDSEVNTRVHSRTTRHQLQAQSLTTKTRNSKNSSKTKHVPSLSEKNDKTVEENYGSDREQEVIKNVIRNISFDEESENPDYDEHNPPQKPAVQSQSKRRGSRNTRTSNQQPEYKKGRPIDRSDDDDSKSIASQDSDVASYKRQTIPQRKAVERQSIQQGKENKTRKTDKEAGTEISNDKENIFLRTQKNRENHIHHEISDPEQFSSSDEDEALAIVNMVSKAKERRDIRERQEKQDQQSTAFPKKANNNKNRQKQSSKESTSTDDKQWKDDEIIRFTKALHTIPLSSPRFWQSVAELVETRTAQECQSKYEEQLEGRPKRDNTKAKQAKPQKVVAITGGVGTVKRKRELRQLIQQTNDGYSDDIFDSTPYKRSKINLKMLVESYSSDDDDDDGDDDDNDFVEEQTTNKDHKTPSSRTPSNRFRPLGPTSNSSCTPTAELISPSLLQPVDRAGMDYYIQRMKQGRRGFPAAGHNKKAKTSTPTKLLSVRIPKVDSSMFEVLKSPDPDSEEESDDYFSDE